MTSPLPLRLLARRIVVELGSAELPSLMAACEVLVQEHLDVWSLPVTGRPGLPALRDVFSTRVCLGVHGVRDAAGVRLAIEQGAEFILADSALDSEAIELAREVGVAWVGSAFTPTEVQRLSDADAVAITPANVLDGAVYGKALGRLEPDLTLLARGDITSFAARSWLRAGVAAVVVSGELTGAGWPAVGLGDLRKRAKAFQANQVS